MDTTRFGGIAAIIVQQNAEVGAAVPEPSTFTLSALAFLGIMLCGFRRGSARYRN